MATASLVALRSPADGDDAAGDFFFVLGLALGRLGWTLAAGRQAAYFDRGRGADIGARRHGRDMGGIGDVGAAEAARAPLGAT
jgi:hypothetical protein